MNYQRKQHWLKSGYEKEKTHQLQENKTLARMYREISTHEIIVIIAPMHLGKTHF